MRTSITWEEIGVRREASGECLQGSCFTQELWLHIYAAGLAHLTLLKQVMQTSQGFTDSLKESLMHTHN